MARATDAIPHSDAFADFDTNTPTNSIASADLDGYTNPFPDLVSHSNGDTFTAHTDPNDYPNGHPNDYPNGHPNGHPDALSNRPIAH